MSAHQENSDEKNAEALFEMACLELASGRQRKHLVAELVRQQWTKEAAQEFIGLAARVLEEQRNSPKGRAQKATRALTQIQTGVYWLIGGGAWMFGSWLVNAVPNGSIQLICYIAMIYGGVEAVSGLMTWWPLRELSESPPYAATRR